MGSELRQTPTMNPGEHGRGKTLAILGTALQIGPLVSLLAASSGIANCLYAVFANGLGDPATLVPAFMEIFESVALGLAIGLAGLVLISVALVGCRYRAPWLFWFLVVYSALLLPVFPVGTAFGAFFLGYCLKRREEFAGAAARRPEI